MAQRTTMAQSWWPRSIEYATCSTTREADSTAVTDLRDIDILSRAPPPCARFINTIVNSIIISIIKPYVTRGLRQREPTDHAVATCLFSISFSSASPRLGAMALPLGPMQGTSPAH